MEGRRRTYNRHERPRNDFMSDYETYLWGSNRYVNYNSSSSSTYGEGYGSLKVTGIDMNIRYNTETHRTKDFDITNAKLYDSRQVLVVRRGQKFYMKFTFDRHFNPENDDVRIIFQFGKRPLPSRESHVELKLSSHSSYGESKWNLNTESIDGASVTFSVDTPPTCPVGKWHVKIDVQQHGRNANSNVLRFGYKYPIYILFNPWCEDDQVYMKDGDLLKEYILNGTGKLYGGSAKKITFIPWNFGQFTGNVLDCVMFLLDELSNLPDNKRGDAVHVSREISSLVNSNDENGVIIGNWSGRYDDGTSPLGWTGSASILDEYFKYKKPVKYGQCFTFSGVVTTVCRALGIPARSVTNYNSAHDTDGSITIDTYFDRNFEEIGELNTDSIWNFHSWNDVWMTRPDLPPGYDGWQAIDSTPQERSKGIYCLGPMSLKAIKSGRVYLPYDGPMAFAEVNADKILWMNYSPGKLRAVKTDKSFVGKLISTKKPLANSASTDWMTGLDKDREDITDQYKYLEGAEEERIAVEEAKSYRANDDFEDDNKKDVEFELSADNNTFIGETLQVSLKVKNQRSKKTRTVVGLINVKTIYYTGVPYKEVVKGKLPRTAISGKDEKMFRIDVPVNLYLDKLTDHFFLSVTCSCMIEETEQTFADTVEVRLRKPHLTIEAPDTGYIGQPFKAETTFTNPLPVPLTNCYLRAEGPGRQLPITYKLQGINQGQAVKIIVEFTPVKAGEKEIIMNCTSDQLANINATRPIYING